MSLDGWYRLATGVLWSNPIGFFSIRLWEGKGLWQQTSYASGAEREDQTCNYWSRATSCENVMKKNYGGIVKDTQCSWCKHLENPVKRIKLFIEDKPRLPL